MKIKQSISPNPRSFSILVVAPYFLKISAAGAGEKMWGFDHISLNEYYPTFESIEQRAEDCCSPKNEGVLSEFCVSERRSHYWSTNQHAVVCVT